MAIFKVALLVSVLAVLHLAAGFRPHQRRSHLHHYRHHGDFRHGLPRRQCEEEEDRNIEPVCAQYEYDERTYPNKWAYECLNRNWRTNYTDGACENSTEINFCQLAYRYNNKVCGSDNRTYHNYWHLKCSEERYQTEITVQHEGRCNYSCPLNLFYKPVCGSNGHTYSNKEALDCHNLVDPYANVTVERKGHCYAEEEVDVCDLSFTVHSRSLLCASNGITYFNVQSVKCVRQLNPSIRILHMGLCTVSDMVKALQYINEPCAIARNTPLYAPVCASDGQTYSNPFMLACDAENHNDLRLEKERSCDDNTTSAMDDCELPHYQHFINRQPRILSYRRRHSSRLHVAEKQTDEIVCGSDGVTYSSESQFECQTRKLHLLRQHRGDCREEDNPCSILEEGMFIHPMPVCASDGNTYADKRRLWCAASRNPGQDLRLLHFGECI